MNYETFNLHPSIMEGVRASGYSVPTPAQLEVIPTIIKGRDIMGQAKTGKGKTAAFILPILQRLQGSSVRNVQALIISPTRDLAEQTREVIIELGRKTGLQSVSIYNGVSMERQAHELRQGVEIVVACPDRLLNHLWRGSINLEDLEILVIDEADMILQMGFLPDIRNILACILTKRQTLLFSSTMHTGIRRLADEILKDPVVMQNDHIVPEETVLKTGHQKEKSLKTALLKKILSKSPTDPVLVFTRTRHYAERLARHLMEVGYALVPLHGQLSLNKSSLAVFRAGSIIILVVMGNVKRRIDVASISRVIDEGMIKSSDESIYHVGRNCLVDKDGNTVSLVTGADAGKVNTLEQLLEAPLELLKLDFHI